MSRRAVSIGLTAVVIIAAISLGIVLLGDDNDTAVRVDQQGTDASEQSQREAELQQDVTDLQREVREELRQAATDQLTGFEDPPKREDLDDDNDEARGPAPRALNSSCPTDPLPLKAGSVGPSSRAALAAEPAKGEPRVVAAIWASRDRSGRGDIARNSCGKTTWRRTVAVTIDRRAYHPSASASLGVYFVSRFADGYEAWGQPH